MILFYVSGHGFGHATRTRAIIDVLDLPVCVRSEAPAWTFGARPKYYPAKVDFLMVERAGDALAVDLQASAASLRSFVEAELPDVVSREANWVRRNGVRLIAADIPFAAGLIGKTADVPVVALGNFLWSWILGETDVPSAVHEGYRACSFALRYPLHHAPGWDLFPRVIDVPLVTPRSARSRAEIREQLGLGERKAVLVGGRAVLPDDALDRMRRTCPDWAFLRPDALPDYHDLVRASDVVVSKLGYSVVAECIAERRAVLYPRRSGFREDLVLESELPRYCRALPIPHEAWRSGDWRSWLKELSRLPEPSATISADGAQVCARYLRELWAERGF